MKFFAKFFWLLLPVALLVGTYREANSTVRRYIALGSDREAVMDTQKDLNRIITLVAAQYRVTRRLPPNLKAFLDQMPSIEVGKRERDRDVDAWLVPYQLNDLGDRYELVSCGPDQNCETEIDNLIESAKKVDPAAQPEDGKPDKMDAVFKNVEKMNQAVDAHNKQLEGAR